MTDDKPDTEKRAEAAGPAAASEAASAEKPEKGKMGAGRKALIIIAAALALVLAGCIVAFAVDDSMRAQYVPENTMLDGRVDISGKTEAELRELIANRVENNIATAVFLGVGDKSYQFDMTELGSIDIDATVDQAFAPRRADIFTRIADRVAELATGTAPSHDVSIKCATNPELLAARVASIASEADCEPKDAGYSYDSATNCLVVAPAEQGIVMDQEKTAAVIEKAVGSTTSADPNRLVIEGVASVTEPDSTEPGQAIFVDTRRCRTHLYENGVEVKSYPNSPGTSGYATPTGDFYLSYKDGAPVWINPHSPWSEGMAETIAPGPSNPLGLRALAVSCGGGIFLHGTTSTGALGSRASHGCVRHSNSDIIDLYDRVSEGIPIIIR